MTTKQFEAEDGMIITMMVPDDKLDPKEEAKKKADEEKARKQAAIEKKMAALALEESDDEEEMAFTEVKHEAAEEEKDDGFEVEEGKAMRETFILFAGNQFLLYDFAVNKSWQVGDIESVNHINDAASM